MLCALLTGCAFVEKIDPYTLARMENKFNLPSEVELFLHEAMPIVEKERAILLKKYAKLRKIYNNLDLTKSKAYSTPSRKICDIKRESVFSDLMAFAEKLCELNSDIEKVYIKYQTMPDKNDNLNKLIDEIDKISAKISRINEEIK